MSTNLYVGNLSFGTDNAALNDLFAEFGTVESAKVITDRDSGRSRGFGFVEMSSGDEAEAAITALDGKEVDGRALKVNQAKPKENRSSSGGGYGSQRY